MADQIKGKWAHVLQYGVASVMGSVAIGLLVYMLELHQAVNYLAYAFYILFLVLALRSWGQKRGNLGMSYGKAFGHAMLIAVVYSLIAAVWTVVFVKVIAPGYVEAQQELQYEKMSEDGMADAQIEMARTMGKRFSTAPVLFAFGLLGSLLVLTIVNLIVAAFFIRPPVSPVDVSHIPVNNPYSPYPSDNQKSSDNA
ncbi:MAG: DUF4199 domain-containing protein [Bacteroidia bacterium]|jgi:hypothetical protein|nr:DUF4199 domain-containing protein [Bacteroidia bacterium]